MNEDTASLWVKGRALQVCMCGQRKGTPLKGLRQQEQKAETYMWYFWTPVIPLDCLHSRLWKAFSYFQVPDQISGLVQAYFEDMQMICSYTGSGFSAKAKAMDELV